MSVHTCPSKLMTEDIVISGMSGRFPESDTTDEFTRNLFDNVDMITDDGRRWPKGLFGANSRMGRMKRIDQFDGSFFGFLKQLAESFDPQSRILLETTYEAFVDAGINPQSMRGTDTGVYIGYSTFGQPDGLAEDFQIDCQESIASVVLEHQGQAKSLYANRISFVFDFKGPSMIVDTACSSSLTALNLAANDLRLGKCDQALVGATMVCSQAQISYMLQASKINAFDGIPKVWDEKADGFVRAEAVVCLLLQRKSEAKRIYATVLNTAINIDGNKRMGMFFPSSEIQEKLMVRAYTEANVDPLKMSFFECHGTGTKAGDTQEARAVYNAYCLNRNREKPLPIGLLKSNIGHCEGSSGLTSLVKVLLCYENESIPACLHLDEIKSTIKPFCPPLLPVVKNMEYEPGIAGINNFGLGGVNTHALIEPNYKTQTENNLKIVDSIPRLVNICCRTESAFNELCKWIEDNSEKVTRDFLALLTDAMKVEPHINSSGMPYRGSLIIKQLSDNSYEYKKQHSVSTLKQQRPICFVFPGLGGQWVGMAKALMPIKIFADKIDECHKILEPFGIDLKHLLLSDDKNSMSTMTNKFCATTAIEICLFDLINELGIIPDKIIGHSFGEIAVGYADGCLTTEEALLITYYRGVVTESDKRIPKGMMAVVGVSWAEAKNNCGNGVEVVCNNEKETVVVSGLENETKQLVQTFKNKGVFVHELNSNHIPYHSQFVKTSVDQLNLKLKTFLKNPKLRSHKWISTSIIESEFEEQLKYASAEYFAHNLISPVYFYNKLSQIPEDAIVVEIGPHPLFSRAIKDVVKNSDYISLLKKNSNDTNLDTFLESIAKLYGLGLNPNIELLYPKVEWPVARGTQSISSLIRWDHSDQYFVRLYPEYCFRPTSSDMNIKIDLNQAFKSVIPDHIIDGQILYPAVGYLMLAWRQLASYYAKPWIDVPVVFEDINMRRAIFLNENNITKIKVKYLDKTGDFIIEEAGNICCFGKIRTTDEDILNVQHLIQNRQIKSDEEYEVVLDSNDFYKDLGILSYNYGPSFRKLLKIKTNNLETFDGEVEWDGSWITFMDSMLQSLCMAIAFRQVLVPVMIKYVRCDPKKLFEAIDANIVVDDKEDKELKENVSLGTKKVEEFEREEVNEDELEQNWDTFEDKSRIEDMVDKLIKKDYRICKAVLPFYVDLSSRLVVTHGIEIEDILGVPIARRSTLMDLELDSYQFVANQDSTAIDEYDKKSVLEYIKVCSTIADKIKNKIHKTNTKNFENINEELLEKYLNDIKDEHILLKILDEINKKCVSEDEVKKLSSDLLEQNSYNMDLDLLNQFSKNEQLIRSLLDIVSENYVPKKEIRVLEINTTNAIMAEEVDQHLASFHIYPIDVNYTIALKSTDGLSEEIKKKSFKTIEWKPEETAFPSEANAADLVVYRDSFDLWQLNKEEQLKKTFNTVVDNGFLLAVFKYRFTEPEVSLNQLKGAKDLKNTDLEKQITDYLTAADKIGFKPIGQNTDTIGWLALLFRKLENRPDVPKIENIIEIKSDFHQWFDLIKEKLKQIQENNEKNNIWLIANDSEINGIIGLINCLRLEPGGECLRCLFDYDKLSKLPINFTENPFSDVLSMNLTINVLKNGKLGTYRHLTLPKDYDKTETNQYFLNTTQNIDLSSLQWFDSRHLAPPTTPLSFDEKEAGKAIICNVYMAGIIFKDIMMASARVSAGPLSLVSDCVIGTEFSGRRCDNGKRVMGFAFFRAFGTSITTVEDMITEIPEHWTMAEGATVLSTYATVWYGLIERAHLLEGESILIHSGAGGVGQSAITVCQYYNCDIYVTVGNNEKKNFLMTEYNIPENRIFSSRDIQFKYKIKEMTAGKGVNIVLNSLAGDKLDASFECVADSGRFVEIGKFDLQMNKKLGGIAFLRDISFIAVGVDMYFMLNPTKPSQKFFKWIHENASNGLIKPLNHTIYDVEEAKNAFRFMTTGKHIGKLMIRIREEEDQKVLSQGFSQPKKLIVTTKTYFDSNKVYIITGGLGGFGLELLSWMIFLGARKVILTSRFGIKNVYQKFIIRRLELMGQRIKYFQPNIVIFSDETNTIDGSMKLIKEANNLGPIGGVFHLALVLNDCLIENQTIEKFTETVDSKIKCFENLDQLTRKLNINLDYFVVFSSVACGKGNAGQSNYSYANSICERICETRRRVGLHGLAIQWGPIGDVGVFADKDININLATIVKQRVYSCLEVMDKLLQTDKAIVSCVIRSKRTQLSGTKESKIVKQLWQALGIDPKTTPNHLTLGEIGMESMFAVELQQGLDREYNIKVTLNDVKNITVGMMKDFEAGKVDELKKFGHDINKFRTKLSKVKFIIPTERYTKLNNVTNGEPVYFLPPLEGIFASLDNMIQKMNRPVIGLNWIRDLDSLSSAKEIGRYYTDLMKTLEPKGNYDIVGPSFGGLIAMKMFKKGNIRKAVIIDMLSDLKVDEESITDDNLVEMILDTITKGVPAQVKIKLKRDIQSKPDVPSKMAKVAEELREFVGKSLVSTDLEEILNKSFKRAKLFTTYRLSLKNRFKQIQLKWGKKLMKIRGKLMIIKTLDGIETAEEVIERIKDAYFLPEESDEKLKFETVCTTSSGDNNTVDPFEIISANINNYLS